MFTRSLFPGIISLFFSFVTLNLWAQENSLKINELEYLEMQGLNIMLAHDFYPESHQGGVGIIQNGVRVATNGDLRLEPTPGQWQPVPKVGKREVDLEKQTISVRMEYPDPEKDRKGFNPIEYPDLHFSYYIRVKPEGKSFKIIVDLEKPLPDEWIGKVGFNFELFPGVLFGKSYSLDDQVGIFPLQPNGPMYTDEAGELQIAPLATGKKLVVAPESDEQRMMIQNLTGNDLQLIDGRGKHNNGWYVVRSLVQKGATTNAIEWLITPHAIPDWKRNPVVQLSQVGYHSKQKKVAVIELDSHDTQKESASLIHIKEDGKHETILKKQPAVWGKFLRYQYLTFDFSAVVQPGMYQIVYGGYTTEPFQINDHIFERHVWQPTLEYFLPVQMCHVRVNERYRVWHDFCHLDDALMAPIDNNHFDGYKQGPSTLTKYKPGDAVPGLNVGGWHDAGDFDLRIESQAATIHNLSLMYEMFLPEYDNTAIDQKTKVVEIQVPDGKNDFLQQIEHGALSIVGGYKSLGRFYRGIICPTLRQYVLLGDATAMTDNKVFDYSKADHTTPPVGLPGSPDDRLVFTEENTYRELQAAAALASTSRALKNFNPALSVECLRIAVEVWNITKEENPMQRLSLAVQLFLTTSDKKYSDFLISMTEQIAQHINRTGAVVGPTMTLIKNKKYTGTIREAVKGYLAKVTEEGKKNPYGVPYEPNIWGAGWTIQSLGVQQFLLHTYYPDIFPSDYMLHAMNFVLGCHPGSNTSSFASGVGSKSLTVAYGLNRADWSYIPGGIGSGTALIRPDYPELLEWPFLWQQTEYVLGEGTTDFLFLILGANHILNK